MEYGDTFSSSTGTHLLAPLDRVSRLREPQLYIAVPLSSLRTHIVVPGHVCNAVIAVNDANIVVVVVLGRINSGTRERTHI